MKKIGLLSLLLWLAGCQHGIDRPQAYLDAVLGHPVVLHDVWLEYRINALPSDYFLARELTSQPGTPAPAFRDSLKKSILSQYGGNRFYLVRLGLDSLSSESQGAQSEFVNRMLKLQSNQEAARREITGHLKNGGSIHPDIIMVDSDLITKQGVAIMFGFRKEVSNNLERIEFGKSFGYTRNQFVEVRDLEPKFRLKG